MDSTDSLKTLLSTTLDEHVRNLLEGVDLTSISRVPSERIARTATTKIALIELVSGPSFESRDQDLYESSFHGGERERSDLIVARLQDQFSNLRDNLTPYHVIGLRDSDGKAMGAAQFSILFLSQPREQKSLAVPYLQYIYISPSHRRQDLSEVLHTLVVAVTMSIARRHWGETASIEVPYTLCETEPPVHGSDSTLQAKAKERAGIHTKSGSIALMLRDPKDATRIVSAHVQPGLEMEDPPITLIWILRANSAIGGTMLEDQGVGSALLKAYYQSLRDEGFYEGNIRLAEKLVEARRRQGCTEFCLFGIGDVRKEMYVGIDGEDTAPS